MINIPKGTKDVLPEDSYKWRFVEDTAREIARLYFLKEIRTPVFEHTELFNRGVGDTSDVVTKEMYTFQDKGGRSITLKPEGTAGAARSFIENGMGSGVLPAKMYYIIPAFRYEGYGNFTSSAWKFSARKARIPTRKRFFSPIRFLKN